MCFRHHSIVSRLNRTLKADVQGGRELVPNDGAASDIGTLSRIALAELSQVLAATGILPMILYTHVAEDLSLRTYVNLIDVFEELTLVLRLKSLLYVF